MHCSEFLRLYSEYRDGRLRDARVILRLDRHVAACPGCARYDASVSHGVQALRRSAVELEPRPDFRARLRQRIAAGAEPAEPITPGAAGLAALLMLAAALALLIHERSASAVEPGPMPMTAAAPSRPSAPTPMVVVNPSAPFVTFTDLSVPAFNGAVTSHVTSETPIDALANLPR